jgi:putative membrane protein
MHTIARVIKAVLKAAVFFTLFAFALNNQDAVTVRFFFGHQWTMPMVLVVFTAFASGLIIGILGMVPRWWRPQPATPPATNHRNETQTPHHGL